MSAPVLNSYFFEDLSIGMKESLTRKVEDSDVIGFAQLSGDENPIHLCDVYASKTRFGQRIAHGLYTASLISAILGTRLPGPGAVYLSQTLHFRAPVKIDETVMVSVEVIDLSEKGRRCTLHCEARVGDTVVLDGQAIVMVPARPKEEVAA